MAQTHANPRMWWIISVWEKSGSIQGWACIEIPCSALPQIWSVLKTWGSMWDCMHAVLSVPIRMLLLWKTVSTGQLHKDVGSCLSKAMRKWATGMRHNNGGQLHGLISCDGLRRICSTSLQIWPFARPSLPLPPLSLQSPHLLLRPPSPSPCPIVVQVQLLS